MNMKRSLFPGVGQTPLCILKVPFKEIGIFFQKDPDLLFI